MFDFNSTGPAHGALGKVVSANDLLSGEVIYLTKANQWSPRHRDAAFFATLTVAKAHLAEASKDQLIVGAYLAAASLGVGDIPQPVHFREVFRTLGPSNQFHGKQARGL